MPPVLPPLTLPLVPESEAKAARRAEARRIIEHADDNESSAFELQKLIEDGLQLQECEPAIVIGRGNALTEILQQGPGHWHLIPVLWPLATAAERVEAVMTAIDEESPSGLAACLAGGGFPAGWGAPALVAAGRLNRLDLIRPLQAAGAAPPSAAALKPHLEAFTADTFAALLTDEAAAPAPNEKGKPESSLLEAICALDRPDLASVLLARGAVPGLLPPRLVEQHPQVAALWSAPRPRPRPFTPWSRFFQNTVSARALKATLAHDDVKTLKKLIKLGLPLELDDLFEPSVMRQAVRAGALRCIDVLAAAGAPTVEARRLWRGSLIEEALWCGHPTVLDRLWKELPAAERYTEIERAATTGSAPHLAALLARGGPVHPQEAPAPAPVYSLVSGDPYPRDSYRCPMNRALRANRLDLITVLKDHGAEADPTHLTRVFRKNAATFRALFPNAASLPQERKDRLLQVCVWKNDLDGVDEALRLGADPAGALTTVTSPRVRAFVEERAPRQAAQLASELEALLPDVPFLEPAPSLSDGPSADADIDTAPPPPRRSRNRL